MRSLRSLTSAQITAIANALAQPTTTTTTTTRATTTTTASTTTTTQASSGAALYGEFCDSCHKPSAVAARNGGREVWGARSCTINGAINATRTFPNGNGVPAMDFLRGVLSTAQIQAIADFLNLGTVTGQQRYITTCAGCHGADARGGLSGENVRGASAGDTREAIGDESEMRFLSCLPRSDLDAIGSYLRGSSSGDDDDEREEDDEHDD